MAPAKHCTVHKSLSLFKLLRLGPLGIKTLCLPRILCWHPHRKLNRWIKLAIAMIMRNVNYCNKLLSHFDGHAYYAPTSCVQQGHIGLINVAKKIW